MSAFCLLPRPPRLPSNTSNQLMASSPASGGHLPGQKTLLAHSVRLGTSLHQCLGTCPSLAIHAGYLILLAKRRRPKHTQVSKAKGRYTVRSASVSVAHLPGSFIGPGGMHSYQLHVLLLNGALWDTYTALAGKTTPAYYVAYLYHKTLCDGNLLADLL